MNSTGVDRREVSEVASPKAAVATMAAALGVFVARPYVVAAWPLMALFGLLLALGLAWPLTAEPKRPVGFALGFGMGAFVLGRVIGGAGHPVAFRPGYLAGVMLAAVAEEAFFRRFVYAVLRPGGAVLAVAGSSALFAIAHVTVYGWWVLPLDLAAGLVLSWQRWSSGTWTVPAATHVLANLLVVL